MIVRGLDSNHDWLYGKGKNDYLKDIRAIQQNIETRLKSFLGDCPFDLQAGIDWFNLNGGKSLLDIKLAVSAVILNTLGVKGIIDVSVALSDDRKATLTYRVETIYGRIANTIPAGL